MWWKPNRRNRITVGPSPKVDAASTTVVSVATLLPGTGSATAPETVAVFTADPAVVGTTTTVTVAIAPAARLPRSAVSVPADWLTVPWLAKAETKLMPAGSASSRTVPLAELGPALVTVRM